MNRHSNQVEKEFFLVQKCWFDGPNVKPPVDYLALFPDRRWAEELASHSAHVHASHHQAVVRTILLPTGYAFSSAGDLFWVRPVIVDVVQHATYGMNTFAHAIFTGTVIGGTGNVNSRRGSEAVRGVVFVGPDSHARALGASNCRMSNHTNNGTRIGCIPMAPLENVMDGWAGAASSNVSGQPQQGHAPLVQPLTENHHKRSARQASNVLMGNEALAECSDFRPFKKQCGMHQRGPYHPCAAEQQQPVDTFMQTS